MGVAEPRRIVHRFAMLAHLGEQLALVPAAIHQITEPSE
jgi:hypothetical protein